MSTGTQPTDVAASPDVRAAADTSLTSAHQTFETVVFSVAVAVVLAAGPCVLVWWVLKASSRSNDLVTDVLAAVVVATSAGAWMRVLRPEAPIRRFPVVPVSVQRSARHIVERSAFGVGRLGRWTSAESDHGLTLVRRPESEQEIRPSERDGTRRGDLHVHRTSVPHDDVVAAAPRPATAVRPVVRSIEYVVMRGDSFWSLAEQHLGDGRRWTEIRDLNVDREVAPGVVLSERTAPQVGHRILLPDTGPAPAR